MRVPRIHLAAPLAAGGTRLLENDQARYLRRVLRLDDDHPVRVFDGVGGEHEAWLRRNEQGDSVLELGEPVPGEPESGLAITLIQGVCRGQRMDYALQKAVELGVHRIECVFCDRTVVRLDGKRLAKRLRHWRGVVAAACAQSGRRRIPEVVERDSLSVALEHGEVDGVFLEPEAESGLGSLQPEHNALALVVGPEGGLSPQERRSLEAAGYTGRRLGPRVLRTETAGVAALTALQTLWGDLG